MSAGAESASATASPAAVVAMVVTEAEAKTKGYLSRIEASIGDPAQCIKESHLDKELVDYDTRYVGKVRLTCCSSWDAQS